MTLDKNQFLQQLNWRYAVKRFDPNKKVTAQDWSLLEESLRLSPSSYGLQPYRFIVVQDPELRKKLRAVSWNQSQVEDCSHYVVFVTMTKMTTEYIGSYIDFMAKVRGISPDVLKGYRDLIEKNLTNEKIAPQIQSWTQRQAYIALGNLMNAAAVIGVDTCPIEGLEPTKYDELLDLGSTDYSTVATCAVGYRHPEDKNQFAKKVRFPKEEIIFYR